MIDRFAARMTCLCLMALAFAAVSSRAAWADDCKLNTLTDAEKQAGWKLLFDGKTFDGWRNYRKEGVSEGWKIADGAMVRQDKGAGDIITDGQYDAFELSLEFKISKEGNSGIMFHVTEEENTPWKTGPEIQVQDNVDGHDPQKAGWLYQLYPASTDATKPVGEWNHVLIHLDPAGSFVEMNGVRYYEFVKGSKDWDERVAKSKFSKFPKFGKPTKGHICLQDHNDVVSYRNIKLRTLSK